MQTRKLRTQLIISFMLTNIVILFVCSLVIYDRMMTALQSQNESATIQTFRQAEYSIQTFRKEVDKISKLLIVEPIMMNYLENPATTESARITQTVAVFNKITETMQNYDYIQSIYIYTEDGRIVGMDDNKSRVFDDMSRKSPFYTSVAYQVGQRSFPKLAWVGGYTTADYNLSGRTDLPANLISAVRGIKTPYQKQQSATLIINVRQSMLTSIYHTALPSSINTELYMIDERNLIISHENESLLLKPSLVTKPDNQTTFGSFTNKKGKEVKQVVYYTMESTGWTLIKEIPISEFLREISILRIFVFITFLLSIVIALFLSSFWLRRILSPLLELVEGMKLLERGKLGLRIRESSRNELGHLARQFNKMSSSILELIDQNKKTESEKRRTEIRLLQSQINPHFLYNTLNTIKWMAIVAKAPNVVASITSLGRILYPIYKNPSLYTTVQDEKEFTESYISIMNNRFGEKITTVFTVESGLESNPILRFILQPLLENSIQHGLEPHNHRGKIDVHIYKESEKSLICSVSDNGIGILPEDLLVIRDRMYNISDEEERDGKGFGIYNVQRRIILHYGIIGYGLTIDSEPGEGTVVKIRLPLDPEPEQKS